MTDEPPKLPEIDSDAHTAATSPGLQLVIGASTAGFAAVMHALLSMNRGSQEQGSSMTPGVYRLMDIGFGGVGVLGLVVAGFAVRFLLRRRAFNNAMSAGSPDAWKLDYDWTPGRTSDRARKAAVLSAVKCVFAAALALICLWNVQIGVEFNGLGAAGTLILAAATGFVYFVLRLFYWPAIEKAFRQGDSLIFWDGPSPIHIGADWTGRAEVSARLEEPQAWLRYVVERPVKSSDEGIVLRREAEHIPVTAAASPRAGGGTTVTLRFKTEADAPITAWSRYPSRYWELVLTDEKSGFSTAFPMPIYP